MNPTTPALVSLFIGIVVFALKYTAFYLTGSVALYSDALESIVNIVAAGLALLALWVAGQPADQNHPYGHSKAEYFSAVLEGVLIVLAALSIGRAAIVGLQNPKALEGIGWGAVVSLLATLLNLGLALYLSKSGKRFKSPALIADGKHIFSDVVTSVGVLVGVGLAYWTRIYWLDPLLALAVALNFLWTGWHLMRESVGGLMDEAPAQELLEQVREVVASHGQGALEVHGLRARRAGRLLFIEFHLVVPGRLSVAQAHQICDKIEDALELALDPVEVSIHVEPESKAEHEGILM